MLKAYCDLCDKPAIEPGATEKTFCWENGSVRFTLRFTLDGTTPDSQHHLCSECFAAAVRELTSADKGRT